MDWGRAKTILILSFLLLNVLLGFQLWQNRQNPITSVASTDTVLAETNQILTRKHIQVLAEVPKDAPKRKQLAVKVGDPYNKPTEKSLVQPIAYVSMLNKSSVKDVLTKAGIPNADQYQLDLALSRPGVYVFNQMWDGLPLFDVALQLQDNDGEITGYKQMYVEVQSEENQNDPKEQKVISAYTVIRTLVENYLADGSTISDIRLGYHGQRYDSETRYLLPFWRVALAEGDVYYVQAFSGAVEGPQTQAQRAG